jgi:uncharacterized glyoxalase superfamily protein PhnB
MQTIFPFIRYRDAPGAVRWLATALGFEETLMVKGPDGTIVHAEMRFGPGTIWLGTIRAGQQTPKDLGAVGQGLYVYAGDVDAHYEHAKASGAEIICEIEDTSHGSREYTVRDPEGYLWTFGTYMPAPAR